MVPETDCACFYFTLSTFLLNYKRSGSIFYMKHVINIVGPEWYNTLVLTFFFPFSGWHICSVCQKASHYLCYTCTYSLCKACTKNADYVCVRGNKGFCSTCMKTIMLIENKDQADKEMVCVMYCGILQNMFCLSKKKKMKSTVRSEISVGCRILQVIFTISCHFLFGKIPD